MSFYSYKAPTDEERNAAVAKDFRELIKPAAAAMFAHDMSNQLMMRKSTKRFFNVDSIIKKVIHAFLEDWKCVDITVTRTQEHIKVAFEVLNKNDGVMANGSTTIERMMYGSNAEVQHSEAINRHIYRQWLEAKLSNPEWLASILYTLPASQKRKKVR